MIARGGQHLITFSRPRLRIAGGVQVLFEVRLLDLPSDPEAVQSLVWKQEGGPPNESEGSSQLLSAEEAADSQSVR